MHVIFLGGAGAMGQAAALASLHLPEITQITIADLDEAGAQGFAEELRRARALPVRAAAVDVTDPDALRALFQQGDVVMNTTGPFYRFGLDVLRAAIAAKRDYIDICDDWEPTLAMFDLDQAARDAGIVALVGMGASPGASNMLAMMAAEALDEVDDLYTCWGVSAAEMNSEAPRSTPSAAMAHWVQQLTGTIRIADKGALVSAAPLAPINMRYPGLGVGTVYTVGHPEPITLLRYLKPAGRCINAMVLPREVVGLLMTVRDDVDAGLLTVQAGASAVSSPGAERLQRAAKIASALPAESFLPPFFALATGRKAGRAARAAAHVLTFPRGMPDATGVPMSLALRRILEDAPAPGVHGPEAVLDPRWFFDALGPFCKPPAPSAAEVATVSCEFDDEAAVN